MAVMLKSSALSASSKGSKSSFYSGFGGKPNPVFQALEQELDAYKTFMQKRVGRRSKRPKDEAASIAADRLFDIWNKYEFRLPKMSYQKRLLEMGDFLSSIKEFYLALWQCYGRYLTSFGDVNVEEITSVEQFKQEFFPDGFETEDAGFTFRALMGRSICTYEVIRTYDPKLLNTESVDKCLHLLSFLTLVTQVILPKESLYWLVYNGAIHIYSISRHLTQ
ncbi:Cilia- and flagella-associated protein 54 [Lamellibrachia satsuma]|nr:Cilia- and flagella-associated protein 54 [Lamellibrachia satsuma]